MTKVVVVLVSCVGLFECTSSEVCAGESPARVAGVGVREVGCALGEVEQNPVLWTGGDGELKHECYG